MHPGCYMQWAGNLGVLGRASTALAHQLLGVVGSASSFLRFLLFLQGKHMLVHTNNTVTGFVHQPTGRSTVTSHVATCPPSPHLQSDTAQVTERVMCFPVTLVVLWCHVPVGHRGTNASPASLVCLCLALPH